MTLRVHPDQIVGESKSPLLAVAAWWERVRLGDVAELTNGAAFRSSHFNNDDRGMPLIRIRDVGKPRTAVSYDGDYEKQYVVEHGDLSLKLACLHQRVVREVTADEATPQLIGTFFFVGEYLGVPDHFREVLGVRR